MNELFNVVIVRPDNFVHIGSYAEAAQAICYGLRRLGYRARFAENQFVRDATNILVGVHNLEPEAADALPPNSIVYNVEMVLPGSTLVPRVIPFVQRFETWDYSRVNVEAWRAMGVSERVRWLRPGYVPELTTIDVATPTDGDVLFYGSLNSRRWTILNDISRCGVKVRLALNVYGARRNAWIARSKIIVNVHSREDSVLEFSRVSQALSNCRLLITEPGRPDEIDADLLDGMVVAKASELGRVCRELVDDNLRRKALAERGFDLFRRRALTDSLQSVLAQRTADPFPR